MAPLATPMVRAIALQFGSLVRYLVELYRNPLLKNGFIFTQLSIQRQD